jgi:hypothetical protein
VQIATRVREHRLHQRRCGCGHVTRAPAPAGVNAALAEPNTVILDEVRAAPVVHVDETSSNINGDRWWLLVDPPPR